MGWQGDLEREKRLQQQYEEWAKRQQELGEIEDAKAFLKDAEKSLDRQEEILRNAPKGCMTVLIAVAALGAAATSAHHALGQLL
jgi:hypothetical protein